MADVNCTCAFLQPHISSIFLHQKLTIMRPLILSQNSLQLSFALKPYIWCNLGIITNISWLILPVYCSSATLFIRCTHSAYYVLSYWVLKTKRFRNVYIILAATKVDQKRNYNWFCASLNQYVTFTKIKLYTFESVKNVDHHISVFEKQIHIVKHCNIKWKGRTIFTLH